MPFLIFRSQPEHKKALDIIANIYCMNDALPLEQRITGIISSFNGLDDHNYSQVYFFPLPFVYAFQIILAVLLIIIILLQQKGTGLGSSFGGDLAFYRTKRGAEKMLFYITIVLCILFIASSVIGIVI